MKQFVYKIGLFIFIIVLFDILFGFTMNHIYKKIDIGGAGRDNFICDKVSDEIIVFGSSRAEFHYNAQMITDSLNATCYNAGESGCGIILAYGRLLMLLERHSPKAILYEITPSFDLLDEKDNHKFLGRLKQRYDRPGIKSIFYDVDPTERYKMLSGMYRHNSSFLQNLVVYFFKISTDNAVRGFRAINQTMDTMKVRKDYIAYDLKDGFVYDSLKLHYINKFLDKTENVNLFFVMSPMWYTQDTLVLAPIKAICKKRNICLIDFSNNPKYVHNNEYFKDGTHLNARGADEFTRDLIQELRKKEILKQREK